MRVARELRDLPGREIGGKCSTVSWRLLACRRLISSWMLTSESDAHVLQLFDLGFELGDRLFEIREMRLPWARGLPVTQLAVGE